MDWKLYYDDGTTYSSEDGDWLDAPAWGVVGIAVIDPWSGYQRGCNDYYAVLPWLRTPWSCDIYGLIDFLILEGVMTPEDRLSDIPPQTLIDAGVKIGRVVDNGAWAEVSARMADDPDLPRKSTKTRLETR